MTMMPFTGVLFFPVTPFTDSGIVDLDVFAEHIGSRLQFNPGGVFPACGTGEFHALSREEVVSVTRTAVEIVNGKVPVVPATGGSLGNAVIIARAAENAGADALLLLPPYLVTGTVDGLVRYVEAIAEASALPVIVYHRANARFTAEAMAHLVWNPKVIGFKDGTGDIGLAQEIFLAIQAVGRDDFYLFNGLPTAELSQGAYRGIGIPLYSSAAFAMSPELANAHYQAYSGGDEATRIRLLTEFYQPFVRLRDQTPGFGVSLIKAGLRLRGLAVGSVRPPLTDPNSEQMAELERIITVGDRLVHALQV